MYLTEAQVSTKNLGMRLDKADHQNGKQQPSYMG